jgi:hypothetical protein
MKPINNISAKDIAILRELAKTQVELAHKEENREHERRIRDMHSLKAVRPPVWIDEIPWHEMDIKDELKLICESEDARRIEEDFRRTIFRWKYFRADMVVEDTFYVAKTYTDTGIGVERQIETLATDERNSIVAKHYLNVLDTEEKVDALVKPVIQAQPDEDKKKLALAEEIFYGIMPVKLRGLGIYYAPWDKIASLHGVENCLIDMADRPDFLHRLIRKFTEIGLSEYGQMEEQGLLDYNQRSLHCTPPYTDELPAPDYDGGGIRLKDIWFRGMAQIFAMASPEMQDEFDLQYMRPLMEKCGLSYYGCCEPLDKFIPYLKKVPNMRKIGVSPWANVRSSAEQIGGAYVLARKPNPAHVAGVFDPIRVKKEITETIEVCLENKCPYEFVLKDISTVTYKPQNLIDWTRTVMETIDSFYA